MALKKSLPPLINTDARVLILGSMPGEESLRLRQYYGHPRNHFWRIIADTTGKDFSVDYETKKQLLLESGIALWDVIESCERAGSLDTNIKNELPNNIPALLEKYTGISAVFFNGQKSAAAFRKAFGFSEFDSRSVDYFIMPSTSPANTMDYNIKLKKWSELKNRIAMKPG